MPSRNGWEGFKKGPHDCNSRRTVEGEIAVIEPLHGVPALGWAVSLAGGPIDAGARTHHIACEIAEAIYNF